MKNKKKLIKIAIIIIVIIIIAIICMKLFRKSNKDDRMMRMPSTDQVESSIQTIENTLSSSGQVSSGLTEKQYLHTGYYFEKLLVSENVLIEEGTKIIEYTNGTYLTAPYDCVVIGESLPNQDEKCTTNHYVQISSTETLCMNLSVSETDINKIEIGDTVKITMTASGEVINGFITSVSEVGTYSSSGSYFTAVVTFDNNGNQKIGMSATCEIIIESAENVVAVPVEAIQTSDEGKYVIVVNEDGTTNNVIVETGISNDAYTEIKSGISENTTVKIQSQDSSENNSFRGGMPGGMNFEGMPSRPNEMPSGNGMPSMPSGGMPDFSGGGMPNMR